MRCGDELTGRVYGGVVFCFFWFGRGIYHSSSYFAAYHNWFGYRGVGVVCLCSLVRGYSRYFKILSTMLQLSNNLLIYADGNYSHAANYYLPMV